MIHLWRSTDVDHGDLADFDVIDYVLIKVGGLGLDIFVFGLEGLWVNVYTEGRGELYILGGG